MASRRPNADEHLVNGIYQGLYASWNLLKNSGFGRGIDNESTREEFLELLQRMAPITAEQKIVHAVIKVLSRQRSPIGGFRLANRPALVLWAEPDHLMSFLGLNRKYELTCDDEGKYTLCDRRAKTENGMFDAPPGSVLKRKPKARRRRGGPSLGPQGRPAKNTERTATSRVTSHDLEAILRTCPADGTGNEDPTPEKLLNGNPDEKNANSEHTYAAAVRRPFSADEVKAAVEAVCREPDGKEEASGDPKNPEEASGDPKNPEEASGDPKNPEEASGDPKNPEEASGDPKEGEEADPEPMKVPVGLTVRAHPSVTVLWGDIEP